LDLRDGLQFSSALCTPPPAAILCFAVGDKSFITVPWSIDLLPHRSAKIASSYPARYNFSSAYSSWYQFRAEEVPVNQVRYQIVWSCTYVWRNTRSVSHQRIKSRGGASLLMFFKWSFRSSTTSVFFLRFLHPRQNKTRCYLFMSFALQF
jgi:hypothetical protein